MTQKKKKVFALAGTGLVVAAVCIFGGQYVADRIQADREADLQAQIQANALAQTEKEQEPVLPAPIETETVYDENGNVAIEPDEPDPNNTVASDTPKAAEPAVQPAPTETKTPEVKAQAPAKPAPSNTETKASTPKRSSSTADKSTTTKPSGGSEKKDTSSNNDTVKTDTPSKDTSKNETSSGGGSNDGKVYVPGFGYVEPSGGESIPVTSDGDINEIIGH